MSQELEIKALKGKSKISRLKIKPDSEREPLKKPQMLNNINFAYNNYISKKYPISLVHFITNRCNARCSFCFIDFDSPDIFTQELNIDEIEKLSRTFGPSLKNINLTGGEPFSRQDIYEIADIYFTNTTIDSLYITSNGSLPDRVEKFLRKISKKHPSKKIIISLSIDDFAENHDKVRKIKGLFEKCIETYSIADSFKKNIFANVSITVSHENYDNVINIYDSLVQKHGVKSITACLVRDEGVYKTPIDKKEKILDGYKKLTTKITNDRQSGKMFGYDPKTIQGRMMNKKNEIMYKNLIDTYLEPKFISYCPAGSLFGVISAKGDVNACEILENNLGNLRNYDMNFTNLWSDLETIKLKKWIKDSKCNCSYECAWSFNILSNVKYQKDLLLAAAGKKT